MLFSCLFNPNNIVYEKNLLSQCRLLSAAAVWAAAANSYTELQSGAKIAGASPEGRYAVGYDPMQCDAGMVYLRSFIYDTEAGELEWVTQYDLDNLSNGGQFNDVSDAGMVIGTAKDMDHIVTWSDPDVRRLVQRAYRRGCLGGMVESVLIFLMENWTSIFSPDRRTGLSE